MFQGEKVTFVRYGFHVEDLLSGLDDYGRYDVDKSVQEYVNLCWQALSEQYPGAQIEILLDTNASGALSSSMGTLVEMDKCPAPYEIDAVEYLCNQIYQEYRWVISRPWLTITEAHKSFGIPIPVIHWTCKEGAIEEATKREGRWEFPLDAFGRIVNLILPFNVPLHANRDVLIYHCQLEDTNGIQVLNLPKARVLVVASDDFGIVLLNANNSSVLVSKYSDEVSLEFEHFTDVIPWTGIQWSYDTYTKALVLQARRNGIASEWYENECDGTTLVEGIQFQFVYDGSKPCMLRELIDRSVSRLDNVIQETEVHLLGGPIWKKEYEQNESLFCQEVLNPLLRKMGFESVRYIHGPKEYGKDFTFSEQTRFDNLRHYGLQAKAGNLSGEVNSEIDKILGQIEDAFIMPYYETGSREERYISNFIIAISGRFTENAEEKIRHKILQKRIIGSVYFWDREKILELIGKYWTPH